MSSKIFCDSGKHSYKEVDVVTSVSDVMKQLWILVACNHCDSKFLREVDRPLP